MGFCPNCGSYVSPAANVCSCGTTLTYGADVKDEQEPTELKGVKKKKESFEITIGKRQKS